MGLMKNDTLQTIVANSFFFCSSRNELWAMRYRGSSRIKQPDNIDKLYWGNKKCGIVILLL